MNLVEYKNYSGVSGIYLILQKDTNRHYIGSTNDFYNRNAQHRSELSRNKHGNRKLQRAVNKYGIENFEFRPLCTFEGHESDVHLVALEKYMMKRWPPYFNAMVLDDASTHFTHTDEAKKKIGIKSKEKFIKNPELIEKIRKHAVDNIAGWNKGMTGIYTEEQRKNLSEKATDRWTNRNEADEILLNKLIVIAGETAKKRRKGVIRYDLEGKYMEEFDSMIDAARACGAESAGNIHTAVKKGIRVYSSYWKYKTEQLQ